MPVVPAVIINQSNVSFVLNSTAYTDINIFIIIFLISLTFLALSLIFKDSLQRIFLGIVSILTSVTSGWMSLNIARLDYEMTTQVFNASENITEYVSSLIVIPMSNPLITILCVIITISGILVVLDAVLISLIPKPPIAKSFSNEWWYKK